MKLKLPLVVTPGDPDGIGPEIVCQILHSRKIKKIGRPLLCVGARKPFEKLKISISSVTIPQLKKNYAFHTTKTTLHLLEAPERIRQADISLPGYQSGWSIQTAVELIHQNLASAMITGPISKERLQKGGFPYEGHTDFLEVLANQYWSTNKKGKAQGSRHKSTMMLANNELRVSLATTHVALSGVSKALNSEKIRTAFVNSFNALRTHWGIKRPKIAIAALNPHAGENGLFGREEVDWIIPEITRLQSEYRGKCDIFGPLPADTLFAQHIAGHPRRYDTVVCMYHDQGLIPVKLLDFPNTVNVTLGLPFVRTSVDHGVAFDIAGKGEADPSSLTAAIELAAHMIR